MEKCEIRWARIVERTPLRISIGILIGILGSMLWAIAPFAEEGQEEQEEPELYAQSAVLMDGKSGRVLWEKEGDVQRPMASTTKIMTCILALELGLDEEGRTVEASQLAASQPQVRLGMRAGQEFYTKDLLYSLMLESHNDAAVAVAEAAAGSVPAFAQKMNAKARSIGCTDTWFITPNGLDGKETGADGKEHIHSTTAEDLARIMRYCVDQSPKAEAFLKITRTQDHSFKDAEGKGSYSCHNHNQLLQMMDGALSGKTGFTGGAGYCYTGAVEDEGRVFVIALLGCGWPPHKTYKWSDARELFAYAREEYQYRDIYQEVELPPIEVRDGVPSEKALYWEDWAREGCHTRLMVRTPDNGLKVLAGSQDKVKIIKKAPDYLEAPVERGTEVGAIEYYLNDERIASFPLLVQDTVERFTFAWCADQVADAFFSSLTCVGAGS